MTPVVDGAASDNAAAVAVRGGAISRDGARGGAAVRNATLDAAEIAALGPFFEIETHDDSAVPDSPWTSMGDLLRGDVLSARVRSVRDAIADSGQRPGDSIPARVAASVTHLGLIARPIAAAVAGIATGFGPIDASAGALWWQDRLGGPYPLSVTARRTARLTLDGSFVEAITEECAARFVVSHRVLWGNVASAANGAAGQIAAVRVDLAAGAYRAADMILADPRVENGLLRSGPGFRRQSCCLIYRLDRQAGVCGDCVLEHTRRATG